jgi:hypothetical protein
VLFLLLVVSYVIISQGLAFCTHDHLPSQSPLKYHC